MAITTRPESLTGGCLCEAIRYTITITPDMVWPPTANGTCQCTLCRKFTGSLMQNGCSFPVSSVSPPLASNPSYTLYPSSPTGLRGFCRICGSSLTFNRPGEDRVEILLGTIDERILRSEVGTDLCRAKNHIWIENAVRDVTDNMPGTLWKTEDGGEKF